MLGTMPTLKGGFGGLHKSSPPTRRLTFSWRRHSLEKAIAKPRKLRLTPLFGSNLTSRNSCLSVNKSKSDLLTKAEWLLGYFLTANIFSLLLVRAFHANGLWRDECAVVQLAGMPALSDLLGNFQHEAFPPLFPFIVRIYTILFGSSDTVLRVLGFCIGGLLVGAFWINSRLFRSGVPLVGLGLLSLNTTF